MKRVRVLFTCFIIIILLVPGIVVLFLPDHEISENENRVLQGHPDYSFEEMMDGTWQKKMTAFFSDQIPFRDEFMKAATRVKKFVGYEDIGGVYIGKDHYYFEKKTEQELASSMFEPNLKRLKTLLDQNQTLDAKVLFVPSDGTSLPSYLPRYCDYYDASHYFDKARETLGADFLDIRSTLKDQPEMYYKTDHHWTAQGAYEGYKAYCDATELQIRPYEYFKPAVASSDFYGSLYSKVMDQDAVPDDLILYNNTLHVKVTIQDQEFDSIYQKDKLDQKDKYATFFGGNFDKITINTDCENDRRLLCIKDSFANSCLPYLLEDFEEIVMIDLRYYKANLQELIDSEQMTDILVLYELSNFSENVFMTLGG